MTTIAACKDTLIMATDSRVTMWDMSTQSPLHAFQAFKIFRTRKYIVGCAGDDTDIQEFRRWLSDTSRPRRWSKLEMSAILMSRTRIFYLEDGSGIEECRLPYHAVGSGAPYALAAMNTMHRLGLEIDPELAVMVACDHDINSREPVAVHRWNPIRRKKIVPMQQETSAPMQQETSASIAQETSDGSPTPTA